MGISGLADRVCRCCFRKIPQPTRTAHYATYLVADDETKSKINEEYRAAQNIKQKKTPRAADARFVALELLLVRGSPMLGCITNSEPQLTPLRLVGGRIALSAPNQCRFNSNRPIDSRGFCRYAEMQMLPLSDFFFQTPHLYNFPAFVLAFAPSSMFLSYKCICNVDTCPRPRTSSPVITV